MRRLSCLLGLTLSLASVVACAPATVALPVVTSPRFPEFLKPPVSAALAGTPAAHHHDRAWVFLQAGDFQNADREIGEAFKHDPVFPESDAGYLALARRDPQGAVTRFDRVLTKQPSDVAALVGKGLALTALDRSDEALEAFQAALARDPLLGDIARRVEVLRFRELERSVAAARRAAQSGRTGDAARAYRAAIERSPDSAFLYRELAEVERQRADNEAALEHYVKAVALDPTDSGSSVHIAEMMEARGDLAGAMAAYTTALTVAPDEQLEARRNALRARMELANLPAEYRAIDTAAQLTRGDLAALIGIGLASYLSRFDQRDVEVMTDVRAHWAERWILDVARAGIMDPFANHAFEPRGVVRQADLAQVARRLLMRAPAIPKARVTAWQDARLSFSDVPVGHVAYVAASFSVAAGVLTRAPDGRFQPAREVTGAEATAAMDRIRSLMDLPAWQRPIRQ